MNCPKCNKLISNTPKTTRDDGGLILHITCNNCKSNFETFVSPYDLEEIYIGDTSYAANIA